MSALLSHVARVFNPCRSARAAQSGTGYKPVLQAILLCSFLMSGCTTSSLFMLSPAHLRCEYKINPLGIDKEHPRFDWRLSSDQPDVRDQKQTAYQLLVASSEENLKQNHGDLWDSGIVKSDETAQIVYVGKSLASEQRAYWK